MSWKEIKLKKPSENFNLKIIKRKSSEIKMNGGNDYKPVSTDKSMKRKTLKKLIWAISDGENLYLNCFLFERQNWYALVE